MATWERQDHRDLKDIKDHPDLQDLQDLPVNQVVQDYLSTWLLQTLKKVHHSDYTRAMERKYQLEK